MAAPAPCGRTATRHPRAASGLGPAEDRAVAAALTNVGTAFVQKPAEVEELFAAFEARHSQQ